HSLRDVERAMGADEVLQAGSGEIFQDQEGKALVAVDVVQSYEVWVVEGGRGLCLPAEAEDGAHVFLEVWGQHLEGHKPARDRVLAQKHLACPAAADRLQHPILAEVESAPSPLEQAVRLERRKQTITDEVFRQGGRFAKRGVCLLQIGIQTI